MPSDKPIHVLFWGAIEDDVARLADAINYYGAEYKRIVGIARGGAIPATMLSHRLKLPVEYIHAESYGDHVEPGNVKIRVGGLLDNIKNYGPETLVVDDLWDTGQTLRVCRRFFLPNATYATVYHKQHTPTEDWLRFAGRALPDVWVKFPWELFPQSSDT